MSSVATARKPDAGAAESCGDGQKLGTKGAHFYGETRKGFGGPRALLLPCSEGESFAKHGALKAVAALAG